MSWREGEQRMVDDATVCSAKYPAQGGWDLTTTNPHSRVADGLYSCLEFKAFSVEASEGFILTVGDVLESIANAVW